MAFSMVPFDSSALPAYLTTAGTDVNDELGIGGSGFKVIGFKGKVFAVKSGGESTPIMKDGAPAPYIDVVIAKVWPFGKDSSKVYYATKYTEGSDAKPTCYSNDGVKPSPYAQDPQNSSCATCPHNQWGARITENGTKAKVCADSKRIAIAVPGQLDEPMLMRVPATSLKALLDLGAFAKARRTQYYNLLTRIGFDYTKAHPQLTFTGLGYLDTTSAEAIATLRSTALVDEICGVVESAPPVDYDMPTISAAEPFQQESPKPATKPKAEAKPKAESKAKAQLDDLVDDIEAAPKAAVKVEAAPKEVEAIVEVEDLDGLGDMIDSLGLDD